MPYIGQDLQVAYQTYQNIDDISGSFNGSTTSFALLVGGVAPVPLPLNSQQCLISVGGVIQRPDDTGAEGFRLSGGNIVFSSAPGTGEDFFGVILAGADYVNVGANFPSGSAAVPSITFDSDLDTGIYNSAANQVSITTSGTERLRVDSGGQIEAVSLGTAAAPTWSFTTDANTGIYSPGADTVAISTNGAQRVTVNSSGSVGIGTASPSQSLNVSGNGLFEAASGNRYVEVKSGANSIQLACDGSSHFIYGTGAIPLTFSTSGAERARIDSSGRLLVGTSTARVGVKLEVEAADSTAAFSASRTSNDGGGPLFYFAKTRGSSVVQSGDALGYMSFLGYDGSALREGASIVAVVDGTPGANDMPGRLVFSTTADGASSPTERMRITNAGSVLIGKTIDNGTTDGAVFRNNGFVGTALSASTNGSTSYDLYSSGAGLYRFYVGLGGTIFATSTTISAISDIRFKENIKDIDAGLSEILALKPRSFDWKQGKGKDIKGDRGFIAQEFEQVFPDLIDEWKDPAPEGEEPYKSVRQDLIPVLVKAIQEQQAMIAELQAEVAALKAQ